MALDASGVFDPGAPIIKESGGLAGTPDGADELDFDPSSGFIFGSNMLTGEIIFDDPSVPGGGGVLISAAEIAAAIDPALARLGTARLDGIRSTGEGYLVLTGLAGVIASIDLEMALLTGSGVGAVNILFDSPSTHSFDDLTPLIPAHVPEPSSLALVAVFAGVVAFRRPSRAAVRRRRVGLIAA